MTLIANRAPERLQHSRPPSHWEDERELPRFRTSLQDDTEPLVNPGLPHIRHPISISPIARHLRTKAGISIGAGPNLIFKQDTSPAAWRQLAMLHSS